MRVKSFLDKYFPSYAHMPILYLAIVDIFTYYGTKLIIANREHHELFTPLDDMIPLVPAFIVIYFLAYVQWFFSFIYLIRAGREKYYHIITSTIIALLLSAITFIVYPTSIARPEINGNGIFEQMTALIYSADVPNNLFPSLHCLFSWCVFRGTLLLEKKSKTLVCAQLIMSLLVFASTVFVKQHFVVDILAGVFVVEVGYFLSSRFKLWKVLERLELPKTRRESLNGYSQSQSSENKYEF